MMNATPQTRQMPENDMLPYGVSVRDLVPHTDARGVLIEMFRQEWEVGCNPVQWNVVHSVAGILRGVHVHAEHYDFLVVVSGVLVLGLHDLRPESETRSLSLVITLEASAPKGVIIPPGVAHGFYFPVSSTHVYAVSQHWNPRDEMGCRFDSTELGLRWPNETPNLSDKDREAGSYEEMCKEFRQQREALLCTAR